MKSFNCLHPIVLLSYFVLVLVIAMFVTNPIIIAIAMLGSVAMCAVLQTARQNVNDVLFFLGLGLIITITNPIFSHNGETPLFFINDNPVTFEAILYGAFIAVMLIAVMLCCKCMNKILTAEKFMYLFSKGMPKIALIITMSLRFIPQFIRQTKKVQNTQKVLGIYSTQSIPDKLQSSFCVLSSIITWSMENAVDTASSMKARGYKAQGRTSFSLYKFSLRDSAMLFVIILLAFVVLVGAGNNSLKFNFYPYISSVSVSVYSVVCYCAYFLLCFLPVIIQFKESLKWKYYVQKI